MTAEAATRVRCPYCQKVFLLKKKTLREGQNSVSVKCPYCAEGLVLPAECFIKS
ncbi:hypothetical protein Dde_4027 [Oleidesulfovibrio alaskensis G20]|jgi:uncharacterized Zn-finger protein|uniref:Zinc finger/thioredoxin putative domain-containing protein n=1 Tax=Oleidesulfovibrio alaskensis (strain ATCC BAA-1058 / DSM 17464 / G20) TaxID=207559 RepID=F9XXG4_OLEA2|nr:hypothetical protein Dde_4027 [Oleidesulfovibrio alaskensis G20]